MASNEEKTKEVEKLRKTMSLREACEKVGIPDSVYYYYKSKGLKKTKKSSTPRLVEIHVPKALPTKLVAIIGSAEEIAEMLKKL